MVFRLLRKIILSAFLLSVPACPKRTITFLNPILTNSEQISEIIKPNVLGLTLTVPSNVPPEKQ